MSCTTVTDWIYEEVSKPIEDWEESLEKKCKKASWWNPLKYLCWFVRALVLVIRWIIVTVVTAVVTVVCHLVWDLLSILWDSLKFLGNLFVALVTWDKCRLQEALGNLADVVLGAVSLLGDVLLRPIVDRVQTYRLRRYVSEKIDARYGSQPEVAAAVKKNFNVDSGLFGFKMTVDVHRIFVDSEKRTHESGALPNLIYLHKVTKTIDLYKLAGFDHSCAITKKDGWRRSLPRTAKKNYAGGGGGLIESDPPEITREELDQYIESDGTAGPAFTIMAMSTRMLNSRMRAAESKGRQLGLLLTCEPTLREVTDHWYMNWAYEGLILDPFKCETHRKTQYDFLICELGRWSEVPWHCCTQANAQVEMPANADGARRDLCHPAAIGVFNFPNNEHSGWTYNLIGTSGYDHDLSDSTTSGLAFRAQIPDEARKWVLIHELGHYFGLTHVDGFDRLMVSGAEGEGTIWTVQAFFNYPLHGGPRFIYVEAKRVWNFIMANFADECLVPTPSQPVIL